MADAAAPDAAFTLRWGVNRIIPLPLPKVRHPADSGRIHPVSGIVHGNLWGCKWVLLTALLQRILREDPAVIFFNSNRWQSSRRTLMRTPLNLTILAALLGLTTACAPPPPGAPPNYYTTGNALMGAAAGAAIGHAIDPTGGAVTGALGGALIGGAIGNQMDYQEQQLRYYEGQPPRYYNYDDGYYNRPPPRYYNNPPPY